jgi:hypothetical protein
MNEKMHVFLVAVATIFLLYGDVKYAYRDSDFVLEMNNASTNSEKLTLCN